VRVPFLMFYPVVKAVSLVRCRVYHAV